MSEFALYDQEIIRQKAAILRERRNKKERASKRRSLVLLITFTVFFAILLGIILAGYAKINEVKYGNFVLKKQLTGYDVQVSEYKTKISENIDLGYVEKYAAENLGLIYPQDNQTQVIKVAQKYTLNGEILASIKKETFVADNE